MPTYNEAKNVKILYNLILKLNLNADLLFIDDNSLDGTGDILDSIARENPCVRIIHRKEKSGVGSAHKEAIAYAYKNGYKTLITMDADFSHRPEDIPLFLGLSQLTDIVVGSRFLNADSLEEWNWYRTFLTHLGHKLTKYVLRCPYDATGAFRLYRLDKINKNIFNLVESQGYSFFFESLFFLANSGVSIREVSITLPKRVYGSSKMRVTDVFKSLQMLIKLYFQLIKLRLKSKKIHG